MFNDNVLSIIITKCKENDHEKFYKTKDDLH